MTTESESWRRFGAQALHYFDRPHEGPALVPVEGSSAWKGAELRLRDDWAVTLDLAQIDELESAAAAVAARPLESIAREDFPLPTLAATVRGWAEQLDTGRGFLLLRGLPVQRWGDSLSAVAYWGLGLHLGIPGGQNPQDELLGHVVDYGEDSANPFVRKYRTTSDIAYHCDLADVVGLLCLRTAREGGASRIVSSVSVYNEVLRRRPDLVARLYEPFLLDTRDEAREQSLPFVPVVPCRFAGGRLRTFYHSDYFRSVTRHPSAPAFTPAELELLDLYEAVAASPELYLDMNFEAGDVQLISNHTMLHARTGYLDWPEPQRRRHLLRLWLSLR